MRSKLTLEPRQEIETWVKALGFYDNNEFDESLRAFDAIADTSKILFNCGVIHATLGEHEKAVSSPLEAHSEKGRHETDGLA
jgi:tetratricopeptide (TPR) repeat protein